MNTSINTNRKGIISIDFWFTLVDGSVGGEKRNNLRLESLQKIAKQNQTSLDAATIKEAYSYASSHFEHIWLTEQRTLSTKDLVSLVLNHLQLQANEQEIDSLSKVYAESLWEGPPALALGVKKALKQLSLNYDLGIISDTMYSPGSVLRTYLDREGVLSFFKAFVFSDEVGYSKPDQRAFESIRKQLKSSTNEKAYHIGDLVKTDIRGANNSGFHSIQYTGLNVDEPLDQAKDVLMDWNHISRIIS